MATIELTAENFAEVVATHDIVLVDFWAEWCGPCRRFGPIFEEAARQHPDVVFGKVDTEAQPDLAGAFQIMSIPTLMAFRDQVIVYADAGALPGSALEDLIGQVAALDMDSVRQEIAGRQAGAEAPASTD
jgi:thioredoxin 1